MVKVILSFLILFSTVMISLSQPLTLGFMVLIQTILVCLLTRSLTFSPWIALSIFLVMVGGLLVVFSYVASVCSNEKFSFYNFKMLPLYSIVPLTIIMNNSFLFSFYDTLQMKDISNLEFIKLFLPLNMHFSIFMFIYLLLALIIMVSLTIYTKGPLRKKY